MIDLHVHILPGFDDGAEDEETSVAMARLAAQDGISCLVATPHIIEGLFDWSRERILEAVGELNRCLDARGVPVQVLPGAEYRIDPRLPECLSRGELVTVNDGGRYLLVELPASMVPPYMDRVLYDLQLQGITPVVVHPERNAAFIREPALVANLAARGILFQITAGSLTGMFGKTVQKTAVGFFRSGRGHCIASDAHSPRGRAPVLSSAVREVERVLGAEVAQVLVRENPGRIIEGREIAAPKPNESKSGRGGYFKKLLKGWTGKASSPVNHNS